MKYIILIPILFITALHTMAQNTYYISGTGNDANDGKSTNTSWKSIRKIEPGSSYLLKRGDTLYFTINKVENMAKQKIVISTYGEGPKPVISLYKKIKPNAWQLETDKIWKVDLKNISNYSGFLNNNDTNVGFIKADSKIYGKKVIGKEALNSAWDFCTDNQYLYVYADSNPAQLAANISIVTNINIINLSDDMDIQDISLNGTGGHAIRGVIVENVNITNVDINEIGGSYLQGVKEQNTRYGNGIEFWQGATNCTVKRCSAKNIYDVAYTMQGDGKNTYFNNVIFTDNVATDNEQSFEFWISGYHSGFIKCAFINNKCYNAGYGWSHAVRPNKDFAVHVLNYIWQVDKTDLTIANNVFKNALSAYMFSNNFGANRLNFFKSENNDISLKNGVPMISRIKKINLLNNNTLRSIYGLEKGSIFHATK